jgi:hypothetical protein
MDPPPKYIYVYKIENRKKEKWSKNVKVPGRKRNFKGKSKFKWLNIHVKQAKKRKNGACGVQIKVSREVEKI